MFRRMLVRWKSWPELVQVSSLLGVVLLFLAPLFIYAIVDVERRNEELRQTLTEHDYAHIAQIRKSLQQIQKKADEGMLWAYVLWRDGSVDLVYGDKAAGWFKNGHMSQTSRYHSFRCLCGADWEINNILQVAFRGDQDYEKLARRFAEQ